MDSLQSTSMQYDIPVSDLNIALGAETEEEGTDHTPSVAGERIVSKVSTNGGVHGLHDVEDKTCNEAVTLEAPDADVLVTKGEVTTTDAFNYELWGNLPQWHRQRFYVCDDL